MSDRVGQQLGNYQLLHLIGRGSFADVYLGEHLHLNTHAAIKVLHTRLTVEESEKLRSEARLMARLAHPHIIRVLEFGVEDSTPFLIMEYAPNGTLRQRHPKSSKVALDIVISYVKQVAGALQYIHTQKLIHRDVKPETMVLGRNNEVLLSDFGIAIIAQSTRSQQTQQTQEAAGSVAYMAPELLRGKPRPASDQYALAVVTYEWLCGEPPFAGSVQQIASQHLSAHPSPLRTKMPTISSAVEQVVMKALDKDPKQRFAQVVDFALALEEASDRETAGRTLFVPASGRSTEREQSTSASRNLPTGTVTLLFTDIEESTHLLRQLGDRYDNLLAESRHSLQASFQEWNGYEVESRRDVFMVAFARATEAVLAAIEVQRALAAHPWPEGVAVRVRMGLHTGEPTLTSEGYVGLDMQRTKRIMRAGHGGQVLLSQTTAHLVEQDLPDDVNLHDLGEYRLKDLGRPTHLFQLDIAGLPVEFPPLQTLDSYTHNLPVQLTPFIGREQEVRAACDLLRREDVHLLTLTGPGGTGKTRLALQVAAELSDRFVDGVFFVNLAPISDPSLVLLTIAETLGIREGTKQSQLERLNGYLHQKQMLLLLDNFEQVVSAAALVVEVLVACPQLKIMATSREVPHVRANHEFTVPPLPLPDLKHLPDLAVLSHFAAIGLFISRAQAVKPDFQMTGKNAHTIAEICARLDGLPLAIELAAARIKLLSPQALLARLSQRLRVLTSTDLDVPERQQTLYQTIQWSYDLLTSHEQHLFRRLAVFVGGCAFQAVEAMSEDVAEEQTAVLDTMTSLLDKNLLRQTEQEDGEPWFLMLETIREFGLEALSKTGELEATRQAHAAYYLQLAEATAPELFGPQQEVWFHRLERELDNLRAALSYLLERGEARESIEMALRLGAALRYFWQVRSHTHEGWTFLERALERSEWVAVAVRAKALNAAGDLAMELGNHDRGEELCQQSLALFRESGDLAGVGEALSYLGNASWLKGDLATARFHFEESVETCTETGDQNRMALSLSMLSLVDMDQGDYTQGYSHAEEGLRLYRERGNKQGIAMALQHIAYGHLCEGDAVKAHPLYEESYPLFKEIGAKVYERLALCGLGRVAFLQGNLSLARSLLEEASTTFQGEEDPWDQSNQARALSHLAQVVAFEGDHATARALYEHCLAIVKQLVGFKLDIPFYLEGLAAVVAAQGELPWAARLWGTAEALREGMGAPIHPIYRADYERSVAATRSRLGEQAFAEAMAEGRTMSLEQVLAAKGIAEIPVLEPGEPSSTPSMQMPPTSPAGLTPREMEVLRLLAKGLTSAQIAQQLVIGLVTVNSHVRSIYSKLGVTSRAAATRYALEHQLL